MHIITFMGFVSLFVLILTSSLHRGNLIEKSLPFNQLNKRIAINSIHMYGGGRVSGHLVDVCTSTA